MSKILRFTGQVRVGVKGKSTQIGAGTDVAEIDLPDKKYGLKKADIDRIVDCGCGVVVDKEGGAGVSGGGAEALTTDRLTALIGGIGKLEKGNGDHWAEDGVPDHSALANIVGSEVSAADRDAAWGAYQAANPE